MSTSQPTFVEQPTLEERVDTLESRLAEFDPTIDGLKKLAEDHRKGLQRGTAERHATDARVERLENELLQVKAKFGLLKHRREALGEHVTEGHLEAFQEELKRLNGRIDAFDQNLQLQVKELDGRVDKVEKDLGDTNIKVANHSDHLDVLDERVIKIERIVIGSSEVPKWTYVVAGIGGVIAGLWWHGHTFRESAPVENTPNNLLVLYRYANSDWTALLFGIAVASVTWLALSFIPSRKTEVTEQRERRFKIRRRKTNEYTDNGTNDHANEVATDQPAHEDAQPSVRNDDEGTSIHRGVGPMPLQSDDEEHGARQRQEVHA